MSLQEKTGLEPKPGEADETGVSPVTVDYDKPHPAIKSDIEERQAVEVRPMRYVLGIGIGLAIIAMLVVWLLLR